MTRKPTDLMPPMTSAQYGDAIRAAFEEGYVQGAYHTKGRSIVTESKRIALAFGDRIEESVAARDKKKAAR